MITLRFNLRTQVTLEGLVSASRTFFAWWRIRLFELMPQAWRRRLSAALEPWVIFLEEHSAWRIKPPGGEDEDVVLDPAMPDDELRERITRLCPTCIDRRLIAVLPLSCALTRSLRLPLAAEGRLRSVLGLQLDRLSPFRASDVQFDYRRIEQAGDGEVEIEAVIVPKATLQDYEQRLRGLGIAVSRFRFAGLPFALPPIEKRRTPQERLQYGLAIFALAAFAAAALLTPLSRTTEFDALSSEVNLLRNPAQQAFLLREKLQRVEAPLIAASAVLAQPSAVDDLRLLTDLLPKDIQLTDMTIAGSRIRFAGFGKDAKQMIALLRRSKRFARVSLNGPIGRTPDGHDRFEIEVTARVPEGAP